MDGNGLSSIIDLLWTPSVAPFFSGRKVNLLRPPLFFPDMRYQQIRSVQVSPPVGPCLWSMRIRQEQRSNDWHAGFVRFFRALVAVVDQSLVKARVQPPDRDQLLVIAWRTRQIPKADILSWSHFHNWSESAEGQPAAADFIFQQLLVVAARVGTPVRISHYRGPLHGDDFRA